MERTSENKPYVPDYSDHAWYDDMVKRREQARLSALAEAILLSRNLLGFRFVLVKDLEKLQREIALGMSLEQRERS